MIQNKRVVHILAQYKWKAAMIIYRKESQPHFSGFYVNLLSFFGLAVYEIDL